MRNLVRRYVTQEQRKAENEGVTEDDVNEIKNDISAFRFEMIEIMRASGMNTQSATGPSGKLNFQNEIFNILQHPSYYFLLLKYLNVGPGGKKNRQKERRLMKGFNLSTGGPGGSVSTPSGGVPSLHSLSSQISNPLNPAAKKSSLTIAPADISIDMNMKKSPMQR